MQKLLNLHKCPKGSCATENLFEVESAASASKSTGEASNTILICLDERTGSITQLEVVDPSMTHPEALRIHVAIPQGRDKTPEWHGSRLKTFLVNRRPW
ncbi:hypothetical protein K0M31_018897 [Melipona bicolor]|uniref:Uncharacterized protein n=1 Tax=Melipona bicolor TaxID=60889 RepID=A0AA40G463_9HYME|nr:hypothetical protein K0M31_018897 [Melipona bicolor]